MHPSTGVLKPRLIGQPLHKRIGHLFPVELVVVVSTEITKLNTVMQNVSG